MISVLDVEYGDAATVPLALVHALHSVLEQVQEVDLSGLSAEQLLAYTASVETAAQKIPTVRHGAIAELESRHVAFEKKAGNTAAMLVDLLRISPGEARQRVTDAVAFGPRRGLSGEPLDPIHAQTAAALASGSIAEGHARVIDRLFRRLPELDLHQAQEVERWMLHAAGHTHPAGLARFAEGVEARLNPDGSEPKDYQRTRGVSLLENADGSAKLRGDLTPALTAALKAVLGPLSAPEPGDDGTRDDRTPAQRRHDGLLAACLRLLRGGLPSSGGAATTLLVTIDYHDLLARYWVTTTCRHCTPEPTGAGYGVTGYGQLIPVNELLPLAADAAVIPVVLSTTDGIMSYGRAQRHATPAQRRALTARDQGCIRPGCTAPPEWCEAHHLDRWEHHGHTDIARMALLCPHDHHKLDHGAQIVMINGHPHWTDPPWLDPTQTPRRNTAHHQPPDFDLPPDAGGRDG